jgi:acetylornithine deacetylase/succinyl-diaminopimelate desuccinylase-like protein
MLKILIVFLIIGQAYALSNREAGKSCGQKISKIVEDSKEQKNIETAFKECLSSYIQIKTISPKGNEQEAVSFLAEIFKVLEIPYSIQKVKNLAKTEDQYRYNLIASLGASHRPVNLKYDTGVDPILLVNHMDVVDAKPNQWERPELAWSGEIAPSLKEPEREFLWGRGSLDMKGIAITQIISMWLLKNSDQALKRDIHFVALSDEESSGSGAIGLIQEMKEKGELRALSNTSLVLNEGGGAVKDVPKKGSELYLVSVEEKGGAWLDIKAENPLLLLKTLNQYRLQNVKGKIKRKERIFRKKHCEIEKIVTPQSKVNVVASSLYLYLKCDQRIQAKDLVSAFKSREEHSHVKVEKVENIWMVSLETESSSHGSTAINDSVLDKMTVGLYKLGTLKLKKRYQNPSFFRYLKTEASKQLLKVLGSEMFLIRLLNKLSYISAIKGLLLREVEASFGVDGLFRTSCSFSALNYKKGEEASALVDCRLLHTAKVKGLKNHPEYFVKELKKKINNEAISLHLMEGWDVSQSTIDSKDFETLRKSVKSFSKIGDRRTLVPFLFPAGTDNTWFRNPYSAGNTNLKSIAAYGFFPLVMTEELLSSYHGANERFPIDQIIPTVLKYHYVLKNLTFGMEHEQN